MQSSTSAALQQLSNQMALKAQPLGADRRGPSSQKWQEANAKYCSMFPTHNCRAAENDLGAAENDLGDISDSQQLPDMGGAGLLGAPVAAIGNKNNISLFSKRG